MNLKYNILLILIFFGKLANSQNLLELNDYDLGKSLSNGLYYFEDTSAALSPQNFMKSNPVFETFKSDLPSIQFTQSRFYIPFKLVNNTQYRHLYFSTARPITNKVILYELENGKIVNQYKNGDDYPFLERSIRNRKPFFQIKIQPNTSRTFLLMVESDGEMIYMPLTFYNEELFAANIDQYSFWNGIFYGFLLLSIIVTFTLYFLLRQKTFLFYSLYASFLSLTQFSIDGYLFQYFFGKHPWLSNHLLLVFGGMAGVFCLIYAMSYLNIKDRFPRLILYFRLLIIIGIIGTIFTLFGDPFYTLGFPFVNTLSLISLLLVNFLIIKTYLNSYKLTVLFPIAFNLFLIGAFIFILGNFNIIDNSYLTINALKISTILELSLLSFVMAYKYKEIMGTEIDTLSINLNKTQEKLRLEENIVEELNAVISENESKINKWKNDSIFFQSEQIRNNNFIELFNNEFFGNSVTIGANESHVFAKSDEHLNSCFTYSANTTTSIYGKKAQKVKIFVLIDVCADGSLASWKKLLIRKILDDGLKERSINSPSEAIIFTKKRLNILDENLQLDKALSKVKITIAGYNLETGKFQIAMEECLVILVTYGEKEIENVGLKKIEYPDFTVWYSNKKDVEIHTIKSYDMILSTADISQLARDQKLSFFKEIGQICKESVSKRRILLEDFSSKMRKEKLLQEECCFLILNTEELNHKKIKQSF